MNPNSTLAPFFKPHSVAIIGASRKPGKIGHEILRNMKLSKFGGEIFPINPSAQSILGFKVYPNLFAIGREIDLAIIVVPAEMVSEVLQECADVHVKGVIVITSGFGEVGNTDLERKVVEIARKAGIRVIGPNTFGIFCAESHMNCSFGPNYILSG